MVERHDGQLPLKEQAELLTLSRRSLYYKALPPSTEEVAIKHAIDRIYTEHPVYGSRRIAVVLERDHGLLVNRKAVQRHMREMGVAGISPGPNSNRRNPEHRVYPYLLRDVTVTKPNQAWAIDITYIRLVAGWMYLVAVLDLASRYVVSWALDDSLELPFVLDAVQRALAHNRPEIWNSDHLVISPAHSTSSCWRGQAFASVWTAKAGRSTTSLGLTQMPACEPFLPVGSHAKRRSGRSETTGLRGE